MRCVSKNKIFYIFFFTVTLIFIFSNPTLFSSSISSFYEFEDDLKNPKVVKILSIDGGGIRGIVPLKMIKKIEQEVGKPIAQIFDLIAGTSTGGLIALASTLPAEGSTPENFIPMRTPDELLRLYTEDSKGIFGKKFKRKLCMGGLLTPRYSSEGMAKVTKEIFGDAMLSDIPSHVIVPAFSTNHYQPHCFDSDKAKQDQKENFPLSMIGVGIGAAPTFFSPAVLRNMENASYSIVDGGIFANNPTMTGVAAAREKYSGARNFLVVSLGTGADIKSVQYSQIKNAGGIGWIGPLIPMMMAASSLHVHKQLEQIFPPITIRGGGKRKVYYRLQPPIRSEDKKMDDITKENIENLVTIADKNINENIGEIREMCKLLKMSAEEYSQSLRIRRSSMKRYFNLFLSALEEEGSLSRKSSITSFDSDFSFSSPRNSMTVAEGVQKMLRRQIDNYNEQVSQEAQFKALHRDSHSQPPQMHVKQEKMNTFENGETVYAPNEFLGATACTPRSTRRSSENDLLKTFGNAPIFDDMQRIMRHRGSICADQTIQSRRKLENGESPRGFQGLQTLSQKIFKSIKEEDAAYASLFARMKEESMGNIAPRKKTSVRQRVAQKSACDENNKYIKSEGDTVHAGESKRKRKKRSRRSETQKRERTPVIVVDALTEEMPKKRVKSKKASKKDTSDQNIKVVKAPRAKSPMITLRTKKAARVKSPLSRSYGDIRPASARENES